MSAWELRLLWPLALLAAVVIGAFAAYTWRDLREG